MGLTYENYPADGTVQVFAVTMPYINKEHIHAYVDNIEDTGKTWETDTTIRLSSMPPPGSIVVIKRYTPRDVRGVDFNNSSVLDELTLDNAYNELFYIMQEVVESVKENVIRDVALNAWDFSGYRAANIGIPINPDDAVSKEYLDVNYKDILSTYVQTGTALLNSTTTKASEASVSAATANDKATIATSQADIAMNKASQAATSETNAATSAANAAASATLAALNTSMFKNSLINGNFDLFDGTTLSTSGYGCAANWFLGFVGSSTTVSQGVFTNGQTSVPNNPKSYLHVVVTSVTNAANYSMHIQKIEGVNTFAGGQATVSFWAKADAAKSIGVYLSQVFGTGGSPSNTVDSGFTLVPLTTSWQKYTVTFSVPSISGKTLGTNNDDYLQFGFVFDAGTNFAAAFPGLGQKSGTYDIAKVQFENGSTATSFEERGVNVEEALYKRFYEIGSGNGVSGGWNNFCGFVTSMIFKAKKRKVPAITVNISSNTTGQNIAGAADVNSVYFCPTPATAASGTYASWTWQADARL